MLKVLGTGAKKYGTEVAERLKAFGEDGRRLIEQYGDEMADIIGRLSDVDAKKAIELINAYGDDDLELFKDGKNVDSVRRILEGGINSYADFSKAASDIGKRSDLTDSQKISELQKLFESSNYKTDINVPSDI